MSTAQEIHIAKNKSPDLVRYDAGSFAASEKKRDARIDATTFGNLLKKEEVERADAGLFEATLKKKEEVERADAGFFGAALEKKEEVDLQKEFEESLAEMRSKFQAQREDAKMDLKELEELREEQGMP